MSKWMKPAIDELDVRMTAMYVNKPGNDSILDDDTEDALEAANGGDIIGS